MNLGVAEVPLPVKRGVLGIWDLRKAPISLGGLLLFADDVHARAMIEGTRPAGICFIGGQTGISPGAGRIVCPTALTQLDDSICEGSPSLEALLNLKGIDACYQAGSPAMVRDYVTRQETGWSFWPALDAVDSDGFMEYSYGTTHSLQQFYEENGFLPSISMKPVPMRSALDFMRTYVRSSVPVVVHLKNNPREEGCSNARLDAWEAFFKANVSRGNAKFILVGNEPVGGAIRSLSNVTVTRDHGCTLSCDLALVQAAPIFMGMASGPCNMAILGKAPYVIYKNPDHHAAEMMLELAQRDHFPFAGPLQKILRTYETLDNLESAFACLSEHVDRMEWEQRLAALALEVR